MCILESGMGQSHDNVDWDAAWFEQHCINIQTGIENPDNARCEAMYKAHPVEAAALFDQVCACCFVRCRIKLV